MMVGVGGLAILILVVVVIAVAMAGASRRPREEQGPRGFPWLLMLLAVAVVAGIVTFILYQSQPVNYVLEINVPSGKSFVGEVVVDGRSQRVEGERIERLEFTGRRISWLILIEDTTGDDSIEVRLMGGAGGGSTTNWGARGFAEKKFIGGGAMFTSVNEEEWRRSITQFRRQDENPDALLPGLSAPSNPVNETDQVDE